MLQIWCVCRGDTQRLEHCVWTQRSALYDSFMVGVTHSRADMTRWNMTKNVGATTSANSEKYIQNIIDSVNSDKHLTLHQISSRAGVSPARVHCQMDTLFADGWAIEHQRSRPLTSIDLVTVPKNMTRNVFPLV